MIKRSARRTISFFNLDSSSWLHLCLSPSYIAGKMMIVRAIECGCRLTVEPPSNDILAGDILCGGDRISLVAVVPSQLASLLAERRRLEQIDNILVGGAPIPSSMRSAAASCGTNVWESYGMTETASHVALRRVVEDDRLPFTMMDGMTCSVGNEGNLCLQTPDGYICTRDMAEIYSPTTFRLLGRLDHAIITGGIKVHPLEVEKRIDSLMMRFCAGRAFYISSVPDEKWGRAVVLRIEGREEDVRVDILRQSLHDILPPAMRPKYIKFSDCFRYTATGKLIRE